MARYSGQGEKIENQPFPAFLTQIYQWVTNISGEPGLAIIRESYDAKWNGKESLLFGVIIK